MPGRSIVLNEDQFDVVVTAIQQGKYPYWEDGQVEVFDSEKVIDPSPPPPEPVPESVTARQLRQWLILHGIMPRHIDDMIDEVEDEIERELLRNYWEKSGVFYRSHDQLINFANRLEIGPDQLDQAFREASTYE